MTRSAPSAGTVHYRGGGGANYGAALGSMLNALGQIGSRGGGASDGLEVCPDGGRVPPGSRCCGNNKYCHAGSICVAGGCLDKGSSRVCSDGRRYCDAGSLCLNDGSCLSTASKRVCSNGRTYCGSGTMCIGANQCLSLSSIRVCANGSYCSHGQMCTNENRCLDVSSPQVCGNGRNYCNTGYVCGSGNRCLAKASPRVCGDGKSFCEAGYSCNARKTCTPDTPMANANPVSAPPAPEQPNDCEESSKPNVDWVFADAGANRTFNRLRDDQFSDFEAIMGAQAHNRPVMDGLRRCRGWVEAYLAGKGYAGRSGQVSNADCRCATVVPTGASAWGGSGPEFRVNNSCPKLSMSVRFVDNMNTTRSDWVSVGDVEMGQNREVLAPAYALVSVKAVQLRRGGAAVTCALD